jgi:crossover junction endodeoxyribonuclease RuvC
MRIISIDPGYERLGLAIIDKEKNSKEVVVFSDCLRTSSKESFEDRLFAIGDKVESIVKEYSPTALSIENLFIQNNQKTAMRVSEVRGALIYIAKRYNLVVREYTPLQIKLAVTGDGKSTKNQVMKMVNLLVKNLEGKKLDDEYDAIAIGLTFFVHNRVL